MVLLGLHKCIFMYSNWLKFCQLFCVPSKSILLIMINGLNNLERLFLIDRKHATDFTEWSEQWGTFFVSSWKKCDTSLTRGGQAWNPLLVKWMFDIEVSTGRVRSSWFWVQPEFDPIGSGYSDPYLTEYLGRTRHFG